MRPVFLTESLNPEESLNITLKKAPNPLKGAKDKHNYSFKSPLGDLGACFYLVPTLQRGNAYCVAPAARLSQDAKHLY